MTLAAWDFDMSAAPRDGTLCFLLMLEDWSEYPRGNGIDREETGPISRALGHNNFDNDGQDEWQHTGWDWCNDGYEAGSVGRPIAWQLAPPPVPLEAIPAGVLTDKEREWVKGYAPAAATAQSPNTDSRRDDGDWIEEEGGKGRLQLNKSYYGDPERVFNALLIVGAVEATEEEVAGWTLEQRKAAAEWALSAHYSAGDNEDVIVPPRPGFIRRKGAQS